MTGLCTQANNGVIVDDPKLAQYFLDEWNLLKKAKNAYPKTLAKANGETTENVFNVDGGTVTQWFAPTNKAQDLVYARKLINAAKEGILFLFFNPGVFVGEDKPESKWTLLQNILFRHHQGAANFDGSLYMRGVVNQEIKGLTSESNAGAPEKPTARAALDPSAGAPVTLFNGGDQPPQRLGYESMVPKNIKDTFHNWVTEILGAGVHIHSKVIVLDPFGQNPVVMTGSHNLGFKASSKNDDNLMIIEGNTPLAIAYAANIIAIYQAYRWNAYVEAHRQDPKVWHGLVDDDKWQDGYLAGSHLAEIEFWFGKAGAGGPAAAASVPPNVPPHAPSPAGRRAGQKETRAAGKKAPAKRKAAAKKKRPVKKKKKAAKKKAGQEEKEEGRQKEEGQGRRRRAKRRSSDLRGSPCRFTFRHGECSISPTRPVVPGGNGACLGQDRAAPAPLASARTRWRLSAGMANLTLDSGRAGSRTRRPGLNKTSTKPAVYGERFVKRRGLFSLAVASRQVSFSLRSRQGS